MPTGSTPTGRHLRTSKKLSRGPHTRGPLPVEWKTAPVEAAQVSLLRWLRRQLRQPIPAREHLEAVRSLSDHWRALLAASPAAPRADAAAWAVIEVLPAHPMITAAIASAATGRAKSQIYQALAQLESAGVLKPLSTARRNQTWEADGLLELIERFDEGESPAG